MTEQQKGLDWVSVSDELPPENTHVLTVDMSEEAAKIWHNVHHKDGHFVVISGERKPTHWAHMNFPKQ